MESVWIVLSLILAWIFVDKQGAPMAGHYAGFAWCFLTFFVAGWVQLFQAERRIKGSSTPATQMTEMCDAYRDAIVFVVVGALQSVVIAIKEYYVVGVPPYLGVLFLCATSGMSLGILIYWFLRRGNRERY